MTREIHKIDADGQILGRLATQVSSFLRGKGKATFQRYIDGGDEVHVFNIEKIKFSGKKMAQKIYYKHSGYMGGLHAESLEKKFAKDPGRVLHQAVMGMLPKNKTRAVTIKRLKIFKGGIKI